MWTSHVTRHDHVTRHGTIECIMCSSIMNLYRVIYNSYMSSHVSHGNESWHNAGHDRVYNVLVYDDWIFSHLWWKLVESCFTCWWFMSQHTTRSSVQCAHLWWIHIEPSMMNAHSLSHTHTHPESWLTCGWVMSQHMIHFSEWGGSVSGIN